jgi:LmbE family N-acetylglucosaminyl deacetylase
LHAVLPAAPALLATDRLLVISPHCDDETLGAGGTIAAARSRGIPVRVVFLTNGDGSLSTQIVEDAHRPGQLLSRRKSFLRMAKTRQREARAALHQLGVKDDDIIFLGYPDGGTRFMWERNWLPSTPYRSGYTGTTASPYDNSPTPGAIYCGQQALQDVTRAIVAWRPTVVLTTHPGDTHPDHYAAYAYTRAALEMLRLRDGAEYSGGRVRLLAFLIHQGMWPVPHGYHPDAPLAPPAALQKTGTRWLQAPLPAEARAAKKSALECYVSQLAFTPYYLRSFVRRNELFGVVPALTEGDENERWDETQAGDVVLPPVASDGLRGTPLQELWPAADIKNVTLAAFPATRRWPSHLTLRVTMARAASARLHYRVALHVVTAQATRPYRLDLFYAQGQWQATLREVAVSNAPVWAAPVEIAEGGLDVRLLRAALRLKSSQSATLLVAATSLAGRTTLDRSSLGALRLLPETPLLPESAAPPETAQRVSKLSAHPL